MTDLEMIDFLDSMRAPVLTAENHVLEIMAVVDQMEDEGMFHGYERLSLVEEIFHPQGYTTVYGIQRLIDIISGHHRERR